jgi:protease YdgD
VLKLGNVPVGYENLIGLMAESYPYRLRMTVMRMLRPVVFVCFAAIGVSSANAFAAGGFSPSPRNLAQHSIIHQVAIFGIDDRRDLPEELGALEGKIGMIYEQSTQTLCTAFCVANDIVATASHCLFQQKSGQFPNLDDVTFRLNYGTTQQQSGIYGRNTPFTKHFIAVGTTAFNNEPPLSAPRDWALVKLEKPICRFGALKVESKDVSELIQKSKENKIFQVAYHWDYKHWQLAYSKPCRIQLDYDQIKWSFIKKHFIDNDQLLLHTCDTGGASSGSPILMQSDESALPVAIAINVGTYTRTRILLRKGQVVKKLNPDIIANTGVNGKAFDYVISELQSASLITDRDQMKKLQTELQARGLYSGGIDGKLGRGTRSAIADFETSVGLRPTGLPTLSLLHRFGQERVGPAHLYSNGRGVVGEIEQTGRDHQPKGEAAAIPSVSVPKPPRRPIPATAQSLPFNPFGD